MAIYKYIHVQREEAKRLSDLSGIEYDFETTIQLSKRLLMLFEANNYSNMELIDALTTAILVRYSRPFSTGVRKALKVEDIVSLSQAEKRMHDWLIQTRNKHIAHSVNTFEENQVCGYYNSDKLHEYGITSISVQNSRLTPLSATDTESVIAISRKAIAHVSKLIEVEKGKVLSILREKNISDLLNEGEPSGFLPEIAKPHKRRK